MLEIVMAAGLCAGLLALTLCVRRRATGRYPDRWFWVACALGTVAVLVGTVLEISGVLLAVPVVFVGGFSVLRGRWLVGDTGLLLIFLGVGTAVAYLLAASLNPDTGSFGDQAAIALVVCGTIVSLTAVVGSLLRQRLTSRAKTL